jgi:hypothetical protein
MYGISKDMKKLDYITLCQLSINFKMQCNLPNMTYAIGDKFDDGLDRMLDYTAKK